MPAPARRVDECNPRRYVERSRADHERRPSGRPSADGRARRAWIRACPQASPCTGASLTFGRGDRPASRPAILSTHYELERDVTELRSRAPGGSPWPSATTRRSATCASAVDRRLRRWHVDGLMGCKYSFSIRYRQCPHIPLGVRSFKLRFSYTGECGGDLARGLGGRLGSGVHNKVGSPDHPRARCSVVIQVSHAPVPCFPGGLDALAQYFFIGIEHDVEHGETSVIQASEYLLQVRAGQDRLRSDEMLTRVASQFCGGSHYQRAPRRPTAQLQSVASTAVQASTVLAPSDAWLPVSDRAHCPEPDTADAQVCRCESAWSGRMSVLVRVDAFDIRGGGPGGAGSDVRLGSRAAACRSPGSVGVRQRHRR